MADFWQHEWLFAATDGTATAYGSETFPNDLATAITKMGSWIIDITIIGTGYGTGQWRLYSSIPDQYSQWIYDTDSAGYIHSKLTDFFDSYFPDADLLDIEFSGNDTVLHVIADSKNWTAVLDQSYSPPVSINHEAVYEKLRIALKAGTYTSVEAGAFPIIPLGGKIDSNDMGEIKGYYTDFDPVTGMSDLDFGQAYYQSAINSKKDGISDKYPQIDGGDGLDAIFDFGDCEMMTVANIHLTNVDVAAGNLIDSSTAADAIVFNGCKFTDAAFVTNGYFNSIRLDDCYVDEITKNIFSNNQAASMTDIERCVFIITTAKRAFRPVGNMVINGSIFLGGAGVITPTSSAFIKFTSNTCYGQEQFIFRVQNGSSFIEQGNIYNSDNYGFEAVFHWYASDSIGFIITSSGSCMNILGEYVVSANNSITVPEIPADYIVIDPKFANAAIFNFMPTSKEVLWPKELGAMKQDYQFATRARNVNMGRLGLIK